MMLKGMQFTMLVLGSERLVPVMGPTVFGGHFNFGY